MSNFIKDRHKLLIGISILIVIAIYVSCFGPSILLYKNDHTVGYLDTINHIRGLDDALSGKVPYKDFYWEYGPFYLYMQLFPYIMFGKNHNALFVSWSSYLPFICIIISFLWAAVFFRSNFYRVLFVVVCILLNVNCFSPCIRHLTAELSIAIFILSLRKPEKKTFVFLAGLMSALAILTSYEYGISSLMTVVIATPLLYFIPHKISVKQRFIYYFSGIFAILGLYYTYLALNGAFISYFRYIYSFMRNYANPASNELLPLLPLISFENSLSFFKSLYNFLVSKNLRFYLPLIIYFLSFIYFFVRFIKYRQKMAIEIFTISFFGVVIFIRVLGGPVFSTVLVYASLPAITLGLLFMQYIQKLATHYYLNRNIKRATVLWVLLGSIFFWGFLTIENKEILNITSNLNLKKRFSEYKLGKVYYDKVGYFISPKSYKQYKSINDYIESHTSPDEYIFVYPWGPYNHFTKRPSPLTARHSSDTNYSEYFIDEAIRQLETRKPRYTIINTFNNLSIVDFGIKGKRGDVGDSVTWGTVDSPNFAGKGDKLQVYILENYKLEKRFDYASVMVRRNKKKNFKRNFSLVYSWKPENKNIDYILSGLDKVDENYTFKVSDRNAYLEHKLNNPILCSHAEITFRVKNNVFRKILSKSFIHVHLLCHGNVTAGTVHMYDLTNHNRYQTAWIGFGAGRTFPVNAIRISVDTKKPYILPDAIEIKEIKLLLEAFENDSTSAKVNTPDVQALEKVAIENKEADNIVTQNKKINEGLQVKEEAAFEDKIIGPTFRILAKTFVTLADINKLKKKNIKKLNKMSEENFRKRYAKAYEDIKNLPEYLRVH